MTMFKLLSQTMVDKYAINLIRLDNEEHEYLVTRVTQQEKHTDTIPLAAFQIKKEAEEFIHNLLKELLTNNPNYEQFLDEQYSGYFSSNGANETDDVCSTDACKS